LRRYATRYLDTVHLIHDEKKRAKLQAKLLTILTDGVQNDDDTYKVIGLRDPEFSQYPVHEESMVRHVRGWLKQHRFVFMGCEDETAATIVDLAKQALGIIPIKLDIFEKLQELRDEELQRDLTKTLTAETTIPAQSHPGKRKKIDLLAAPEDLPNTRDSSLPREEKQEIVIPQQLAMF
jgi:hypothetical protein